MVVGSVGGGLKRPAMPSFGYPRPQKERMRIRKISARLAAFSTCGCLIRLWAARGQPMSVSGTGNTDEVRASDVGGHQQPANDPPRKPTTRQKIVRSTFHSSA